MVGQWSLTCGRVFKGECQAVATVRCELLLRGTGTGRLVVVMKAL
jgi:hypothetical protein